MNRISSLLEQGMHSSDVANLQDALRYILERDAILAGDEPMREDLSLGLRHEREGASYEEVTHRIVTIFQEEQGLEPHGMVDEPTADALNAMLEELGAFDGSLTFIVRGHVRFADQLPAASHVVTAFDRDLRSEERLGESPTDQQGFYEIRYTPDRFGRAEKGHADLLIRVSRSQGGEILQQSDVVFNAPRETTIDLLLGSGEPGQSEYERLLTEVEPLLDGVGLADLTAEDIAFIAGDTGIEEARITWLTASTKMTDEAAQRLAREDRDESVRIPPAAFYSWFRTGIPANLDQLLQSTPDALAASLERAIADNIAPGRLSRQLDQIRMALTRLKADAALAAPAQRIGPPLKDLLGLLEGDQSLDAEQAATFATLQAEPLSGPALWRRAAEVLPEPQLRGVQSLYVLNHLIDGDEPALRAAVSRVRETTGANGATPFQAIAAMEMDDWRTVLLETGQPDMDDATLTRRSRDLTRRVATLMPTDFLLERAARLPEVSHLQDRIGSLSVLQERNGNTIFDRPFEDLDTGDIGDDERTEIRLAFSEMQRMIRLHPGLGLDEVLQGDGASEEKASVIAHRVGLIDTVYRQNPDVNFLALDYAPNGDSTELISFDGIEENDQVMVLRALKAYRRVYDVAGDALSAKETLEAGFTSASAIADLEFTEFARVTGLNLQEAQPIHEAAKERALTAGLQLAAINDYVTDIRVSDTNMWNVFTLEDETVAYLRKLEGFEDLFGRQATCRCRHCRSVLSPAAYFVDLMHFIDRYITVPAFHNRPNNGLKLQSRRPDLWELDLSCDNTERLIPTLQIVNEILERQIGGDVKQVYGTLAQATDSVHQPLVLPLQRVELYLSHFERTRADVARALGVDQATYMRARLSLSIVEHELIVTSRSNQEAFFEKLFGTKIGAKNDVQDFLRHTGWTRDEFGQLLAARYVRGKANISIASEKDDPGSIQNDIEKVTGLTAPVLDRLHRFARLWRKLPWKINELEQVLYLLHGGIPQQITDEHLKGIAFLLDVQQRFGISLEESAILCAGFPPLHFGDNRSLYDRLFNLEPFVTQDGDWSADPAANKPKDPFTHPAFGNGTSQPDNRTLQRLIAGLQVTDQELVDLLIGLGLVPPAGGSVQLSPGNLALLYRHARLARRLNVPVERLLQLLELGKIGGAPYAVRNLDDLKALLALYDQWQASGFSLDDLAFITGGRVLKPEAYPDAATLANAIALSVRNDRPMEFDDTVLTQLSTVTDAGSRAFVAKNTSATGAFERVVDSQRWRLKASFDIDTGTLEFPEVSAEEEAEGIAPDDKLGATLADLRNLLRHYDPRDYLPARIAAQLGLPEDKIQGFAALVGKPWSLHDPDLSHELEPERDNDEAPNLAAIVNRHLPLTILLHSDAWDTDALNLLSTDPEIFGLSLTGTTPVTISVESAFKVAAYVRLTTTPEIDFTPEKPAPDADAVREVLRNGASPDTIARALRVPPSRIKALHPHLTLPAGDPFAVLDRLLACLELAGYLGVSGETLKRLIPTVQGATQEYEALVDAAEGMYGVIRAKYPDGKTFEEKVEGLEDQIRGLQRDGLVEYLIRSTNKGFTTPNDLYQMYLIDTQVEGCARTSRIVSAISSLQLYVHRVQMNLEQEDPKTGGSDPVHVLASVVSEDVWEQWAWRKNYRVWEANRKVFLHPENYLEPALRDDKTPLFEELEATLLQQEINEQNVTDAYAGYVRGFVEAADLKIAGTYHDKHPDSKSDVLHLFGVTPGDPPTYYYRTVKNSHYGEIEPDRWAVWSPWRKIEVQIPVRKVAPVVFRGQLYVFWMEITTLPKNEIKGGDSKFLGYRHKLALKYTRLQLNGAWTAPQRVSLVDEWGFPSGDGVVEDPLEDAYETDALRSVPRYASMQIKHLEPHDGYTLDGFQWVQPYPEVLSDKAISIALQRFLTWRYIDLYEGKIYSGGAHDHKTLGHVLYSRTESGVRRLYYVLPGATPLWDSYAISSQRLERSRLAAPGSTWDDKSIANYEGQLGPGGALGPRPIAQLTLNDDLTLINGSVQDCIVDSQGDLLLIQGSVRPGPEYLVKRLGTTLSDIVARLLFSQGFDGLLNTETQMNLKEADLPITLLNYAEDKSNAGKLDFTGPYGIYFREIFFQIPFIIADHLNSQQRFSAAQRWYHHVYDPTSPDTDEDRVWRYRQFRGLKRLEPTAIRDYLTDSQALAAYREDPFNPHAIARLRLSAYQKVVVMKYIDNLLDWGDSLFSQFTMESVNEATMLYVMAADILGARPADVGECGEGSTSPVTYKDIAPRLTEDSQFLIELEHLVPNNGTIVKNKSDATWVAMAADAEYRQAFMLNGSASPSAETPMMTPDEAGITASASVNDGQAMTADGFGMGMAGGPLGWRETRQNYWTQTGGTDLRNLGSYGAIELNAAPSVLNASDGRMFDEHITIKTEPGSGTGGNTGLPPGTLTPQDYTLPNVHSMRHTNRWEPGSIQPHANGNTHFKWEGVNQLLPRDVAKMSLVFCFPSNQELLAYWDRVESRLFRIRNCMDITGARRQLALFAPEIDPRLLVRARAAGLSLEDVLGVTSGSVPPYRFTFLIEKARQYAGTVQSLGSALLSALEKRDAEELIRLRTIHEQNLLKLRTQAQEWEIQVAEDTLASLEQQHATALYRKEHFASLIQDGLTDWEGVQQVSRHIASGLHATEAILGFLGGGLRLLPQFGAPTAMKYGGAEVGESARTFALGMQALASVAEAMSASAGLEATFQRREEEWTHQQQLAEKELLNLDKQIEAARIRVDIAKHALDLHITSIEQSEEIFAFYRDKFSSFGLYTWLSTQVHRLYRDAFNTAFAVAKMAEQAYSFERDDDKATFLSDSHWDTTHSGLLAGERLLLDLQQLERRFLETNLRTLEVEQSFSLMQLAPDQLLTLRQTGECEFSIPEVLFDLVYPGHYRRRIKAVRLTIPCVTGPYVNVAATLRLTGSSLRREPVIGPNGLSPIPSRHTTVIATSSAQNDAGVFEFGFRDERYMPFEGAGAVESSWRLTLPKNFRPFDYDTISDVILRISYTAEESEALGTSVEDLTEKSVGTVRHFLDTFGLPLLISVRHQLPDVWYRLTQSPADTAVSFGLAEEYLPLLFASLKRQGVNLANSDINVILQTVPGSKIVPDAAVEFDGTLLSPPQSGASSQPNHWTEQGTGLYSASISGKPVLGNHTFTIKSSGNLGNTVGNQSGAIDTTKLTDIFLSMSLKSVAV